MQVVVVAEGQTIYDICLLHYGSLDDLLDLVEHNGLDINQSLTPGQKVHIPSTIEVRRSVKEVFVAKQLDINSGDTGVLQGDYDLRDYDGLDYRSA